MSTSTNDTAILQAYPIQSPPVESLAHILGTNTVPNIIEAHTIRSTLTTAREYLATRRADIAHARRVLNQLIDDEQTWEAHIHAHEALLSPARRTPDDVWREIFEWCLPDNYNSLWSDQPPWLLGRICRQWREVVLSCPKLWATLTLRGYAPTSMAQRQFDNAVITHLKRSANFPLNIIMKCPDPWPTTISTICEYSPRWRDVTLRIPPDCSDELAMVKNNLPLLECLELLGNSTALDIFENAPRLYRLAIRGTAKADAFLLPWSQITHFKTHTSMNTPNRFLPMLSSLTHCTLAQGTSRSGALAPMTLPMLTSLCIEPSRCAFLNTITDNLTVPALRSLVIRSDCPRAITWHAGSLTAFLSRIKALERLEITKFTMSSSQLLEILRVIPSLSELSVLGIDDAFRELSKTIPETPELVPNLRDFEIDGRRWKFQVGERRFTEEDRRM